MVHEHQNKVINLKISYDMKNMKKLAIKGHLTRGKEVIEILKMLGGTNSKRLEGTDRSSYYTIESNGTTISGFIESYLRKRNNHVFLTLEEFLEKYPYKVGDKVLINGNKSDVHIVKSMKWGNERVIYRLEDLEGIESVTGWYANEMMPSTEQIKEEIIEDNIIDTIKESEGRYRIVLNHQFDMEVDEGEYYAVRRKPQYPKTYKECCEVLMGKTDFQDFELVLTKLSITQAQNSINISSVPPHITSINNLYKLLICRDAYWLIAGKQMDLGKSWEPDYHEKSYEQGSPIKYVIYYTGTHITKEQKCTPSYILAFPTVEMRDAFYENFKDLIIECKELL